MYEVKLYFLLLFKEIHLFTVRRYMYLFFKELLFYTRKHTGLIFKDWKKYFAIKNSLKHFEHSISYWYDDYISLLWQCFSVDRISFKTIPPTFQVERSGMTFFIDLTHVTVHRPNDAVFQTN